MCWPQAGGKGVIIAGLVRDMSHTDSKRASKTKDCVCRMAGRVVLVSCVYSYKFKGP